MREHVERSVINAGVSFFFTPELICSDSQLLSPKLLFQWNWLSSKSLGSTCLDPTGVQVCISQYVQFLYGCQRSELRSSCSQNTHFTYWPMSLAKDSILSVEKKKVKYFITHLLLSLENGKLICMPNKLSEDKFLYDSLVLTRLDLKSHRRYIHVYKDVSSKV